VGGGQGAIKANEKMLAIGRGAGNVTRGNGSPRARFVFDDMGSSIQVTKALGNPARCDINR
jgi:hypothetical protein